MRAGRHPDSAPRASNGGLCDRQAHSTASGRRGRGIEHSFTGLHLNSGFGSGLSGSFAVEFRGPAELTIAVIFKFTFTFDTGLRLSDAQSYSSSLNRRTRTGSFCKALVPSSRIG